MIILKHMNLLKWHKLNRYNKNIYNQHLINITLINIHLFIKVNYSFIINLIYLPPHIQIINF